MHMGVFFYLLVHLPWPPLHAVRGAGLSGFTPITVVSHNVIY